MFNLTTRYRPWMRRAGFVILVIAGLMYLPNRASVSKPEQRVQRMRAELSQKQIELARLSIENADLTRRIQALRSDTSAVIDTAREDLSWVRPSDVVFVIKRNGSNR